MYGRYLYSLSYCGFDQIYSLTFLIPSKMDLFNFEAYC